MLLFTSIPPRFSRKDSRTGEEIGPSYLAACVESWRRNGFRPISINRPDEMDAVQAMGIIDVQAAEMSEARIPTRYGPPLGALFDLLPDDEPVAVTNADIYMLQTNLAQIASELGGNALLAGRRSDVEFLGAGTSQTFLLGFDFFAFNRAKLPRTMNNADIRRFQLGAPWWDYVFPISCMDEIKPYRLREPFIAHQLHDDRWNQEIWDELAIESCKALARIDPFGFRPILNGISDHVRSGPTIARACHARLFGDGFEELSVAVRSCSYFRIAPAVIAPVSSPAIRSAERKGFHRRIVHGLRDILRVWRRRAGLT